MAEANPPEIIHDKEFIKEMRQVSYLGFSTNQFVEEFQEMFKHSLKNCLDSYEETYYERSGEEPGDREKFRELYTGFVADFTEESLDKIIDTAAEVFDIPEKLIVPGFDDIEPVTDLEIEKLNEEANALEKEYIQGKVYLEILKQKNAELEAVEPLVEHNEKLIESLEAKKEELIELKEIVRVSKAIYGDAANELKNKFAANLCLDK